MLRKGFLKLYKCFNSSFSVTTVYPVAELGMKPGEKDEDHTTQGPTQSFFPTVTVIENSLEASTIKPETHTFVPLIPNILPEATSAVTDETPLMAAVEEESTEGTAEEPSDIITPTDTELETVLEQEEAEEAEVEEVPPTEPDDGGEAEPEEKATDGKFVFKAGS